MSDAVVDVSPEESDHLEALREHRTIATVLARAASQDIVAHGDVDRLYMFADAFRQSDALGYGLAFAFAYAFLQEVGAKDPSPLPDAETWTAICGKPYVAQFSGEMSAKLSSKASWLPPLLCGKLDFPHEKAPPLPTDEFEKSVELLRSNLASRASQREVLAKLDEIKLSQFVSDVSLGRAVDAAEIDRVKQIVAEAVGLRNKEVKADIKTQLRSGLPSDWHLARAWTGVSIHEPFVKWHKNVAGDLLDIAVENGSRGQSKRFVVPPHRLSILNDASWTTAPWRLAHSRTRSGVVVTGCGTGVGAASGAGVSSLSSYLSGALTAAKLPAAMKAAGMAAAFGGAGVGALAVVAWFGFKYYKGSATEAYEAFTDTLVADVEKALIADFMARYRAYVTSITNADNLKAQNALDAQKKLAADRLTAANTYAQPQTHRFRVV